MAKKSIGTITLSDGTKKEVLEQKGKYYICKDAQYLVRKYSLKKGVKKNAESELSERTSTGTERKEHERDC